MRNARPAQNGDRRGRPNLRVIVSHPAKQGNIYFRPRVAERMGADVRFLTGLYYRPHRLPYSLVRFLPDAKRTRVIAQLEKRRIDGLSPENVVSLLGPVLEVALRPRRRFGTWYRTHDRLAARWIRRAPMDGLPTVLHCCQDSCAETLRAGEQQGMVRLLELTLPPLTDPEILKRWDVPVAAVPDVPGFRREVAATEFALVQSEYGFRTAVACGVRTDRVLRLHMGVDVEHFRPRSGPRRPGPLRLLFMGTVGRRKGVHHLLDVWKALQLPDAELLLMGNVAPDGSDLVNRSIEGCRYLGFVPDDERLRRIQDADVLVHPSLAEGGCSGVYEALACGVPCVIAETASSAARDGIEGLVVPPGDRQALAAAIRRIADAPDLRRQFAVAARQRAESLSWKVYEENLAGIYRGLAEFQHSGDPAVLEPLLSRRF